MLLCGGEYQLGGDTKQMKLKKGGIIFRLGLIALVLLGVTACEKKVNPFPDHAGGQIFQGLKNVNVKCSGCHGDLGGGGMGGPDLTASVKSMPQDQFVETVMNGRDDMPAFGAVLKEEEILEIFDWLQKLPH